MIFFITILIVSVFICPSHLAIGLSQEESPGFFVGIDVAHDKLEEIKELIDEVSPYTNLFVIGSTGISYNETKLNETCQYLYDQDMYFMPYSDSRSSRILQLFSDIQKKYEDHFLGVYFDDEQGGKQLDIFDIRWVEEADNYTDAANEFVDELFWWLEGRSYRDETVFYEIAPSDFHLFTSDYTLYWFDYKAGYDTIFAEFGWNYSRQLNVALCRGAATVQNKEWGVMITWTYNNPPYIESGAELYNDLVLAYENGAKYMLVFDSNEEYTHGILQEEHLEALKQFWNYTNNNPRTSEALSERVAYVLPKDYGYGFRGPDDKIWGLWEADDFSFEISTNLGRLLEEYGTKLDIIYDDPEFNLKEKYSKIYFWNSAIFFGNISCAVSSSNISIGDSITVSGAISPDLLANVTLQRSTDNGTTWIDLATLSSTSEGNYSFNWTPVSVGSYELRASLKGGSSISEANSSTVLVTVSDLFSTISYSVSSSLITEGDSVTVSGIVDPVVSGETVTLTIKKPDGSILNRTVTTDSDGSFVDSFWPDAVGYWSVTASWNEDSTLAGVSGTEKSFEITKQELKLELPPSMMLIVGNSIAAIAIIVVIAWFIMRGRKQRLSKTVFAGSEVKAHLLGLGSGTLEYIDNIIKFHLEKGHIRKLKKLCRKIPMVDIEGMNRIGNELRITWKGVTDIFVIEETKLAGTIFERIPQTSREQRRVFEGKELAKQKRKELISMLSIAMDTIDSLFDILRSLRGRSYWSRVEGFLKCSEENARYLKAQKTGLFDLDFTKLSSAIKEHIPEETYEETYSILSLLYDYFSGLATANDSLIDIHPNFSDVKRTILAYYLLNDIILGLMVEDRVEKEIDTFVVMLEDLSKNTGLKIDTDALKDTLDKVGVEQEKESVIGKSRVVFRLQLKKLIKGRVLE